MVSVPAAGRGSLPGSSDRGGRTTRVPVRHHIRARLPGSAGDRDLPGLATSHERYLARRVQASPRRCGRTPGPVPSVVGDKGRDYWTPRGLLCVRAHGLPVDADRSGAGRAQVHPLSPERRNLHGERHHDPISPATATLRSGSTSAAPATRDGDPADEYLPQEQARRCEAIAWLADQPWCSGAVGIYGKSWGGFNALQVAAHRPPALRAVSAPTSPTTVRRRLHYMGGCVLGHEALSWASYMLGSTPCPRTRRSWEIAGARCG